MNRKEYAILLDLTDQRIDPSLPIREEYFREYRRGIHSTYTAVWKKRPKNMIAVTTAPMATAATPTLTHSPEGMRDGCKELKTEGPS